MPDRSVPAPLPDVLAPVDRWTPHRKQRLVDAVASGDVDRGVALARHGISAEEFDRWVALSGARGLRGLRAPVRFHAGMPAGPTRGERWSRSRNARGLIG